MTDFAPRRAAFRVLHRQGCFVIPNPWDRGSAIALARLGFRALATSSAGFGFTLGLPDHASSIGLEPVLEHLRAIVEATELPVNADFQNGYADDLEGLARNVLRCVGTGVSGLSIEDATGEPSSPLYDLPRAVARVKAARAAIDASKQDVLLTARAECFLVGHPAPLEESLRRIRAYAEAGADVLFAPGVRDRDAIRALVEAAAPKPMNVLVSAHTGITVPDLAALGVRRVSVGSALSRVAWTAFLGAARAIADHGDFASFEGIATTGALSELLAPKDRDRG